MKVLLLLTIAFGAALAYPNTFIKYHPTVGQRIVGGDEADIADFPYTVALLRNGFQICGGAIIAPDVILTAAHCVVPSVISNVSQLSFRVGSSQWRSGGQQIAATQIIYHELYQDCDTCDADYDIAVIKLAERINVANAEAIPLVNDLETFPAGTYGVVSGWGVTSFGSNDSPETLRRVNVPVTSDSWCRTIYGSIISERTICAGYTLGGRDACQDDSGGPYAIDGRLVGIVSFGAGCALPFFPGVYANVAGLRSWVRDNSGI